MFSSNTTQVSDGGYQISRSLRFNSADSAYLNRTPASAGNRRTWTWSAWVKRSSLTGNNILFSASNGSSTQFYINFGTSNTLDLVDYNGSVQLQRTTTQVFRDPSAWYHIVFVLDTTQATASNRAKLYLNGTEITSFSTSTNPSPNYDGAVNSTAPHAYGRDEFGDNNYYSGYLTETYLIDGQALTPSSFGETNAQTGVWQPKAYSGSYGTNGFYLNFSDNSNTTAATLGKDYSGNGNNWTPNNFSVTAGAGNDSLVDSPTSYGTDTGVGGTVRGNYATLNPLDKGSTLTLSNGNLDALGYNGGCTATFGLTSGKWYWETTLGDQYDVGYWGGYGLTKGTPYDVSAAGCAGVVANVGGGTYANGTKIESYTTWATNDVIGLAFDADALTLSVYRNNTKIGVTLTVPAGAVYPTVQQSGTVGDTSTSSSNFGQRPFAYTAPSGFKALCTQNLPTPTIGATTATQAGKYFNTITWSGTGSGSTRSLTGVGFQPDWVWTKTRSANYDHQIYDAVRGAGSTKSISSNSTNSEAMGNVALYGYVSAFNSDGFTGTNGTDGTIPSAYYNQSGQTYVAWNWKESVTAGFDIVTYTGTGANRTVAHNLGVAPKMIIVKASNLNAFWQVYNADVGATKTMYLNATNAATTDSTSWNNTAPTSSVFTVGTNSDVNSNTYTYIAYCFAPVSGFSAFGSYTGNGSTDGVFVFTGMRPAYVMIKRTSSTGDWFAYNNKSSPSNVVNQYNVLNTAGVEGTYATLDFLSNGFKLRVADAEVNGSGSTFIYMAFAEAPQKFSLAR